MRYMKDMKFNTLYIIESLKDGDLKTGHLLFEDLKLQEYVHEHVRVEYREPKSSKDWDKVMIDILNDCKEQQVYPIVHLEVHGAKDSIELSNGDVVLRDKVGEQLRQINIATGCNLFLTMGVCKGLYVLFNTHIDKPMPFCGAIGSFSELFAGDIQLRYAEFYETFFRTFDITQAYIQLMRTETAVPIENAQYRYIHVDELFYRVYQNYLSTGCKQEGMKQRALDAAQENGIVLGTRQMRRQFQRDFAKQEKKTRNMYYHEAARKFFMLDTHPENQERFDVPKTFKELAEKCEHLVTI